jgi:RNA polymerase sigma-70 factor (ECF subfamily)
VSVLSGVSEPGATESLERECLERARKGDARAYRDLVRVHQDAIFGLVLRLVRDRDLAEELTQDAFLKAYRSLGSFRGEARFSTWLYRIAVNLCHDYHASAGARLRRSETGLEAGSERARETWSSEPAPDDALAVREAAEAFQAGLDALDSPYREAFVMRHQDDLGYDEIAEVFGISRNNAKVRVHRAREMILAALRKMGHEF